MRHLDTSPPLLTLYNPHRCGLNVTSEHQYVEGPLLVLLRIVAEGGVEVMLACASHSSTIIWYWLTSHSYRCFPILRRINWAPLMWRTHYRVVIWKTMELSAFHLRACTPQILSLRSLLKRLPTFLPGESYRLSRIMASHLQHVCHVVLSMIPLWGAHHHWCEPSLHRRPGYKDTLAWVCI